MKQILPATVLLFLLSSCSSYQYLTLTSTDVPARNDTKEFTWENDTLRLTYNFHGKNGPMTIHVYNKTDQPLYIDWKKSALVLNERSISLFNSTINLSGVIDTYRPSRLATTSATLNASFDLPEGTDFIAPKAFVGKNLLCVQQSPLPNLELTGNSPLQKVKEQDGPTIRTRRASYDPLQSPVHFKIYLTFMTGHSPAGEFSLLHSFYASEIMQANVAPDEYSYYGRDGDKFHARVKQQ